MTVSEVEARDAYLRVEVDLPGGRQVVAGKPVPYPDAVEIMTGLSLYFEGGSATDTLLPALKRFHEVSGITKDELAGLTLGEVLNVINRFFFQLRFVPGTTPGTSAAANPGT